MPTCSEGGRTWSSNSRGSLDVQTQIFVSGSTPELEAQANAADVKVNGLQREFENQERARMEKSGGKRVRLNQGKRPNGDKRGRM